MEEKEYQKFRDILFEIVYLYDMWHIIFDPENIEFLNYSGPLFFDDLNEIIKSRWTLNVAKLADPKEMKSFENLSLPYLQNKLQVSNLLTSEIKERIRGLLIYSRKMVPARNKIISHNDRETMLADLVLSETTEQEQSKFIENIKTLNEEIEKVLKIEPKDFSLTSFPGDASELIKVLKTCHNEE